MRKLIFFILSVAAAQAEPIKFKNGTVVEGAPGKFTPATLEIITPSGPLVVHFRDLDTKWRIAHLPTNPEVMALKEEADAIALAKDAAALAGKYKELVAEVNSLRSQLGAAGLPQNTAERVVPFTTSVAKENEAGAKQFGKWEIDHDRSKIDDSVGVTLLLTAEQESDAKDGRLLIRVQEGALEIYIVGPWFLGSDSIPVTTRIDARPAVTANCSLSTDAKAAFVPHPSEFLRKLMAGRRLVVRFTPYSESPKTLEYDIGGLWDAVRQNARYFTGVDIPSTPPSP